MSSVVSCIKHTLTPKYFLITSAGENADHGIISEESNYDAIFSLGEVFSMHDKKIVSGKNQKELKNFDLAAEKLAQSLVSKKIYRTGVQELDAVTEKMHALLQSAAALLIKKIIYSAPVLIRFHNDIDGSSGAYAVYGAINALVKGSGAMNHEPEISWRMHHSVAYAKEDAENDILFASTYESLEKPLLLVIDFGTSVESNPGISAANGKFDIIWLDHHPVMKEFDRGEIGIYINPWLHGGDSNYTAGFLASVFSHYLADSDTKDLEQASFIGDYSIYSNPTERSKELAAILDLLTSDVRTAVSTSRDLTPDIIERVLTNTEKTRELITYAKNRDAELLDLGIKSVKKYAAGRENIFVADFEKIRGEKHERYPLPGRYASKLLTKIEELNSEPCVLVMHFGPYISIRTSKKMPIKLDVLKLIESMKAAHPERIEAGGGHANAASIKFRSEENKNAALKLLVEEIKKSLSASAQE